MGKIDITRRHFLRTALTASGGFAIGVALPGWAGSMIDAGPWDRPVPGDGMEIGAWIVIQPDDTVTIRVAKSEMGQGIFTALPMIVAEELACDWSKVKAEYASANRNLADPAPYGAMGTGGSRSVRTTHEALQQAGASARVRLVTAAARRWQVPVGECVAKDGIVTHGPSGRSVKFGALAGESATIQLDQEPAIKTPEQFTLIGRPLARLDTLVKVTGQAEFGIDIRVPDMLYAAVATCPVPGGTVKSYDAGQVTGRRGVSAVVPVPNGVAVVADRFWRAQQALAALPVEWDDGAGAGTGSAQFRKEYRAALDGPAAVARDDHGIDEALAGAKPFEAIYEVPHVAHAAMEPLNCTAHWRADRLDIWMGTQDALGATHWAAGVAGLKPEQVFVHNCFLGGGFGRRAVNDEMLQAVTISKAVGKPVKLIWTREEDMRHDRFRPQAAIRMRAVLGPDKQPTAFDIRTAVGSIQRSLGRDKVENGIERQAVEGLVEPAYGVPKIRVECVLKNTHIPVMFWRSVGSSQNAFALESFIDELAQEAGADPLTFRRALLRDKPDFLHVLDVLEEKSGWGQKLPAGSGRGMAIHEAFGTIVAQAVEVAVSPAGKVKVDRVVAVVDCGHVINPRIVEMQIESAVIYGLTAALYDEITIKDGRVEQSNFDDYPMVRMADTPKIETYLALSGGARWGGIGEPGTPPIAPALANGIFAATGKRLRSLPVKNADLGGRA
ncbi:MAG: xanthine dehydrogenase family protein molybdopterin-binding subunit [Aliidongia sp.]